MERCFANILTDNVAETAAFYQQVLGMKAKFSSDWFVNLSAPGHPSLEIGILEHSHEIVPDGTDSLPGGVMLTFVVEDCDAVHERAKETGARLLEAPRDMLYGQRRMILKDPAGTIVDVSSLIK